MEPRNNRTNGNGRPSSATSSRILVVDDEENVRITTAAILEQDGYEVEMASDGREALDKIESTHFDLVLTDLRMEGMDGSALLNELRTEHPEILTVVLTGYASIESSIDALRLGVYDYLVKPCVVDDLKRTVRRALEHQRQRARINELSSPVVEIWDGILLLPVVGTLDDARAAQMSGALLNMIRSKNAQIVIIDITGCTAVDTSTASHLINTVRSARLLGSLAIITGVSALVAADLVKLGVSLEDITTRRRLADGLRLAFTLSNQPSAHNRPADTESGRATPPE
ncbi:MAG TPA: response regulator [Pyrinomonadaceae bacterium]|jgi:CheY-like chemotaxis protein/anti-anti-sigma regulatory factor|nr:response regulator [Pyrinomonadaceae bacterium]